MPKFTFRILLLCYSTYSKTEHMDCHTFECCNVNIQHECQWMFICIYILGCSTTKKSFRSLASISIFRAFGAYISFTILFWNHWELWNSRFNSILRFIWYTTFIKLLGYWLICQSLAVMPIYRTLHASYKYIMIDWKFKIWLLIYSIDAFQIISEKTWIIWQDNVTLFIWIGLNSCR